MWNTCKWFLKSQTIKYPLVNHRRPNSDIFYVILQVYILRVVDKMDSSNVAFKSHIKLLYHIPSFDTLNT